MTEEKPHFEHPQPQSSQPIFGQVNGAQPDITALIAKVDDLSQRLDQQIKNHLHDGGEAQRIRWNTDLINKITPFVGNVTACTSIGTIFPPGWTVVNTATGVCTVTHNLGTTAYSVVATPFIIAGFASFTFINTQAANSFQIECYANGGLNNCDFNFILSLQG